jgi:integrase
LTFCKYLFLHDLSVARCYTRVLHMTVFRMARPMRRKRSSNEQFRGRIPADVLDAARGQSLVLTVGDAKVPKTIGPKAVEIGCSLRTNDPSEVKLRQAEVLRQVETFFAGLRQKRAPVALTLEECVRLAGDVYRGWTAGGPDTGLQGLEAEELEAVWQAAERRLGEALERGPERAVPGLREMAERFLLGRGLAVDEPSLEKLCGEIVKAIRDAARTNARKAGGDFSEGDLLAKRFGEPWRPSAQERKAAAVKSATRDNSSLTFNRLTSMWRDDPQVAPAASTVASYGKSFELLAKMVGHDDPARLSHEDIQRFKEARLEVVSPKTVKANDLAGIRSVLQWAIDEGHLPGPNPARDVKVKVPKGERARSRPKRHSPDAGPGLTDGEALAMLRAALQYTRASPREKAKTAAAKRWVPWLMAYTGARVGEVAQLRKEDVRPHERGFWYLVLSPEAGTIKTGVENFVPLHSHLVELGFIEFVKGAAKGHLFLDPQPDGEREVAAEGPKLKPGYVRKAAGQGARKRREWDRTSAFSRTDDPRGILGPLNGLKNRLGAFAREVITDKAVQPLHGWRHRFKPWAMVEGGMPARMANEIQNHASSGGADGETKVTRGYGRFTVVQRHEAVERLPRYEV